MRYVTNVAGLCISGALLVTASVGSCASTATYQTARLTTPSEATLAAVRAALRTALGRPQLELGVGNYRTATSISVLPPPLSPLETRSVAMPTVFNIVSDGTSCQLVNSTSGEIVLLNGVSCTRLTAK